MCQKDILRVYKSKMEAAEFKGGALCTRQTNKEKCKEHITHSTWDTHKKKKLRDEVRNIL